MLKVMSIIAVASMAIVLAAAAHASDFNRGLADLTHCLF